MHYLVRSLCIVSVVVFPAAVGKVSQAADCQQLCAIPHAPGPGYVEINAATGNRDAGSADHPLGTQLQLLFSHKNPYRYNYRYSVKSEPLESVIIGDFLENILKIPPLNQAVAAQAGAGFPSSLCTKAEEFDIFEQAVQVLTDLKSTTDVAALLVEANNRVDAAKTAFDVDTEIDCLAVCGLVEDALSGESALARVESLDRQALILKEKVTSKSALLRFEATDCGKKILASDNNAAQPLKDAKAELQLLRNGYADAVQSATSLVDTTKKLATADESTQKLMNRMKDVQSGKQAISEFVYPDLSDEPTQVTASVFRTNVWDGSSEEMVGSSRGPVVLRVGKSRLSVSAGIAVSWIDERVVERQSASIPDGMGGTTLGTIFGLRSDSSNSFALTTQLNARLYVWEKYSTKPAFEWSLGVSLEDRDDSDQAIGFYTGPSVSLLDGNLMFTAAYHLRKVERLADGFEVGDTVPDDLQDPLPMTSSNESGFLVSVTYRIR